MLGTVTVQTRRMTALETIAELIAYHDSLTALPGSGETHSRWAIALRAIREHFESINAESIQAENMKIHTYRSKMNKQFYFRIVARNGRIVAQSEGYKRAASRDRTIALFKRTIANMEIVAA